ncbi:MAG: lysophospholipase, partial [Planctomycetota bacterium]
MHQAKTDSQAVDFSMHQGWEQVDSQRRKFVYQWGSQQDYDATVLISHGLGEHGGRYMRLAQDFAAHGLRVVCFDQQGHGKSPEKRGCVDSYESMLDDIGAMLQWIGREKPTVLFGHSMGGNLVMNYTLRRNFQPACVIASSPMIEAVRPPARPLEFLLRCLMRLVPNRCISSHTKPEKLMSDPSEQAALRNDEVFHSSLSLRLGAALLDSGRWLLQNNPSPPVPLLLSHGSADQKTCHKASIRFAELTHENCQLEILADHMHDPFRDVDREEALEIFFRFI